MHLYFQNLTSHVYQKHQTERQWSTRLVNRDQQDPEPPHLLYPILTHTHPDGSSCEQQACIACKVQTQFTVTAQRLTTCSYWKKFLLDVLWRFNQKGHLASALPTHTHYFYLVFYQISLCHILPVLVQSKHFTLSRLLLNFYPVTVIVIW